MAAADDEARELEPLAAGEHQSSREMQQDQNGRSDHGFAQLHRIAAESSGSRKNRKNGLV